MTLSKALKKAKRTDEEKVGLNIKIPVSLKNEFDELCKKNGVSMTSMMLSLIEVTIEESKGDYDAKEAMFVKLANDKIASLDELIANLKMTAGRDELIRIKSSKNEIDQIQSYLIEE